jgi:hypothetical protein
MAEQPDPDERADPATSDLPLEDPRWIPLITEHKRLAERLTSNGLAAADLTKAMADGVIRSMGRRASGRELLSSDVWANGYELFWSRIYGLEVHPRMRKSGPYVPVRGWVFFLWKPDIDKFWLRFELPPVPDQRPETSAAAIDPSIPDGSTQSRVNDEQRSQKDDRQSRRRADRATAQRLRARTVLTRLFPSQVYPLRSKAPDADLWRSFCNEWDRFEGKQGLSPNLRPSRSTVLREAGRKD